MVTVRSRSGRVARIVAAVTAFTLLARLRGYRLGGHTVVRCRHGHLFTTLWIPGVKLKAIDLGIARVQYCPVGHHWSLVTPVRDCDLGAEDRATAAKTHDIQIP